MILTGDKYFWDDEDDKDIQYLKSFVKPRVLPLVSPTHKTEEIVRKWSHVSSANRGEESRSKIYILRSINIYHANYIEK